MHRLLDKIKGDGAAIPPMASWKQISLAWMGVFVAIATIAWLADTLSIVLVLGSFGASCVLIFGYPDVPFSQPRNVVAGHVLSTLVALIYLNATRAARYPKYW